MFVKNGEDVDKSLYDGNIVVSELVGKGKPVLVNFTASWCVPCKTFNPLLEKVNKEYGNKVIIKIVDVDKYKSLANKYPLRVIPSQILINVDGKPFEPSKDLGVSGFVGYSKDDSDKVDLTMHEGPMTEQELLKVLRAMGMKG